MTQKLKISYKKTADLSPYENNPRTHSPSQINQIARSIEEFGFTNPILIDSNNCVIAGHGRLLAANELGVDTVPTIALSDMTDVQRRAYVIADNRLAENAGWDDELLRLELGALSELDFDLDLIGFDEAELAKVLAEGIELSDNYSRKIESPVYEPTGPCPDVSELADQTKTEKLKEDIANANISDDIKAFLKLAAERHTVFNFRNIAEYYAHAEPDVQDLFERSALVIIDFDQAIENGFVRLSQDMMDEVGRIKDDA